MTTTPRQLIDCFDEVAVAVRNAVVPVDATTKRARTDVPGQYALDVIADGVALEILSKLPVRIVSEESGLHERAGSEITVVLDPIDGSTNCSRGIAYWAISICALDADGPLASLVVIKRPVNAPPRSAATAPTATACGCRRRRSPASKIRCSECRGISFGVFHGSSSAGSAARRSCCAMSRPVGSTGSSIPNRILRRGTTSVATSRASKPEPSYVTRMEKSS